MMKKYAVIFGARGGIGAATRTAFLDAGYTVIPVNSSTVNFADPAGHEAARVILKNAGADVVVNCVGHFDQKNEESHNKTFDINVGSNWTILQHYIENPSAKPLKIIMVGSSAYKAGRKDYILYAASKAALYNVWQGACEYFKDTNVTVGLINPVKTRTNMIKIKTSAVCLEPEDVAQEILRMASTNTNELVDMKYPEGN